MSNQLLNEKLVSHAKSNSTEKNIFPVLLLHKMENLAEVNKVYKTICIFLFFFFFL